MTLADRINRTLEYYRDEFPIETHPDIWNAPLCPYARGITVNDLVEIQAMLEEHK